MKNRGFQEVDSSEGKTPEGLPCSGDTDDPFSGRLHLPYLYRLAGILIDIIRHAAYYRKAEH